jgi:hypothetical protein
MSRGTDTIPVAGVRLVLHRVGRSAQGPMDSTRTDQAGRFRFRFSPDTTLLYLISASYAGMEYFSSPVNTNPALPDTALVILVSDTSSTVSVSLAARYLVIRRAAEDGSRGVLDLIVLENRHHLTRVARDTLAPSWVGRIPRGVVGVRVGDADLSADAIVIRNDSIMVFAPIAPGEKQISLEYAAPRGSLIELDFPQDSVATNILAQDSNARVEGGELAEAEPQVIEGESFRRWLGAPHPGDVVRVSFGASAGGVPSWVLPLLVGLAGAGLLVAFFRLKPRQVAANVETLTDRIAELEAKYSGREGEVSLEEWQAYLKKRESLRAEVAALLPRG